jgi:hypothetical protein
MTDAKAFKDEFEKAQESNAAVTAGSGETESDAGEETEKTEEKSETPVAAKVRVDNIPRAFSQYGKLMERVWTG